MRDTRTHRTPLGGDLRHRREDPHPLDLRDVLHAAASTQLAGARGTRLQGAPRAPAPTSREVIDRTPSLPPGLPPACFFARLRFLALAFFFALGQPVTVIFVVCLTTAPFWPVSVVGIVRFCPHMLPFALPGRFAASPECGPSGRSIWNTLIGTSGTC